MERQQMEIKMNKLIQALVTTVALVYAGASVASTLSIPNTFSSGATTSAGDMNANFTAVKAAVDDNDTRITALQASSAPVFQGFSSGTVAGNAGIIGLQTACDASFSGAKICSSAEFASSTYKSATLSGTAWLLPVVEMGSEASATYIVEKTSGLTLIGDYAQSELTCEGFTSNASTAYGLFVTATGGIQNGNLRSGGTACDTVRAVACCK
jgi:hypothetical protein